MESDPDTEEISQESAVDEPAVSTSTRRRVPWRWVAVGVAVLFAASGLFAWWQSEGDESLARAQDRDAALVAARQHVETLNSLDYRDVDAGLEAWTDVTTGTLRDQLADVGDEQRQLLAEQRKISTGTVVDAAVLDVTDESATVIASVEISVQDDAAPGSEPSVKRNRFAADLLRVDGTWKLENLQQVPVNLS